MFPDSINTSNSLTIKEPIKIELSIEKDTMIFSGIIAAAVLAVAIKIFK